MRGEEGEEIFRFFSEGKKRMSRDSRYKRGVMPFTLHPLHPIRVILYPRITCKGEKWGEEPMKGEKLHGDHLWPL